MPAPELRPVRIPQKSETRWTGGGHLGWLTWSEGNGSLVISVQNRPVDPEVLNVSYSTLPDMQQQALEEENRSYRQRIETLERQMIELLEDRAESEPRVRDVTKAVGRREVRTYFKEHREEIIYPSDVADALDLEYDFVLGLIEELEAEGRIAKAQDA